MLLSIHHACDRAIIMRMIDTLHAIQRSATGMIRPAWAVWYRVHTGAACPAFGSACIALHGLSCNLSCSVVPGALGWAGNHRRGIQAAPVVGWVMPAIKFFKEKGGFRRSSYQHPPHLHKTKPIRLCKSPNFPKNTKRPLSRSNLCYT